MADLQTYLGPNEHVLYETKQHWFVIISDGIRTLLLLIALGFALWGAQQVQVLDGNIGVIIRWLIGAGIGVFVALLLWVVLRWQRERLLVTTSKVVHVSGVINRQITSTPLVKVDEVTVRQPLLGRVLGFGRLEVENASGGREPLHGLRFVPHAADAYRTITEEARRQRMEEGGGLRQ